MKFIKKSAALLMAVTMAFISVVVFEQPMTVKADVRLVNTIYMHTNDKFCFLDYTEIIAPQSGSEDRFISAESSDDSVAYIVHNSKYLGVKTKNKEGKAKLKIVFYDPVNGYKTNIFKITVKKPRVKVTMQKSTNTDTPEAILKISNSGGYFYDSIKIKLTFKNSDGDIVQKKTVEFNDIIPKETVWDGFYPDSDFDVNSSTCEIVKYNVSRYKKYIDCSGSISATMKYKDGNYDHILVRNNAKKKVIYGNVTILWYDKDNNIVDFGKQYYELKPGKKDKVIIDGAVGYDDSIPAYDHFEIMVDGRELGGEETKGPFAMF